MMHAVNCVPVPEKFVPGSRRCVGSKPADEERADTTAATLTKSHLFDRRCTHFHVCVSAVFRWRVTAHMLTDAVRCIDLVDAVFYEREHGERDDIIPVRKEGRHGHISHMTMYIWHWSKGKL